MNKTFLKFGTLIVAASVFVGCSKNDDNEKTNEPEFPTQYSELTVEQNKSNLEDNGVSLVNSMTTLKNASGIQTSIAFSKYLDGSTLPSNIGGRVGDNGGVRLLQMLASFGQGKTTPAKTLSGLRVATDGFESFQAEYADVVGVYTYSKANDTWTYEKTGDKIVFKFPSTEAGTVNNAEYSVYGLETVTITSDLGGDNYTGDYPTALKADLTIDGAKHMGYAFSASYNSKGDPSAVSISLSIDSYTLAYEVSNSATEAKFDYSLKDGDKMLFGYGIRGTGNFSSTAVEGSQNVGDVLTTATAYFQIMNIKFSGEVNAKALADGMDAAPTIEEELALLNANYKLIVFYDDSKQKIAESEFYITDEEYTEGEWIWNEGTQNYDYVETTKTKKALEVRLIFADGTKSDLATYTDVGFDEIKDSLDAFIEDVSND
ncbi:hypothetical protein SAMN04488109_0479 [Chryseolinea serpens]|uniref:Uncharacterized protein n=1 Tax=Chryseolinea serpens TaxID=947013 RepID=A0A1M5K756_9BACT|nr:hypothetical protein [Chryseolinea serpens]SHG48594.1 hypothetical protein SAMN04488109_0479 [Chryseolinea serpens]